MSDARSRASGRGAPSSSTLAKRACVAEYRKVRLNPHGHRFHLAFLAVSVGGAMLLGFIALQAIRYQGEGAEHEFLTPRFSAIGLLVPGVLVAVAACAYSVTREYDDGTVYETFLALPNRALAFAVKSVLLATSFAVLSLLVLPVLYVLTESIPAGFPTFPDRILAEGGLRTLLAVPVVIWFLCVMSAAVAGVLKNSAVAIAVVVAWYLVAEDAVSAVPGVGEVLGGVMPVANGWVIAGIEQGGSSVPVGPEWTAVLYLLGWTVVLATVALVLIGRRDVRAQS